MTKLYAFTTGLSLLLSFLCTCVSAQTVVAIMDFDGTTPEIVVTEGATSFFDDGADGFFGIRDANDDTTDGAPADTGDGNNNGYSSINLASITGDYFLVNDLDNGDGMDAGTPVGGTTGFAETTFGPISLAGLTDVTLSFDYQLVNFGSTDEFRYQIVFDGVPQEEIDVVDLMGGTSSGNISACIRAGVTEIALLVKVKQNGGSDYLAIDNIKVEAGTPNFICEGTCGVSLDEDKLSLICESFTEGSTDAVSGAINYLGIEPGVTVTISGGNAFLSADSDDPSTDEGGTQSNAREIRFEGLVEGGAYTITISGGDCMGMEIVTFSFTVPMSLCEPIGNLVINEFLASVVSGGPGEFVELYNRGTEVLDISGYTIEEGSGSKVTVPASTVLNPAEGFVFADDPVSNGGCILVEVFGLSLNDGGDIIVLKDNVGNILHQISYGGEVTNGISRALSPDGNIDGGYQDHTSVSSEGNSSSPCAENVDNSIGLPIELKSFTATAGEKAITLLWSTTNETDNEGFEIQRSADAVVWQTIGQLTAGTESENTYQFIDENPLEGTNIYRLRQVDIDGMDAIYGPVTAAFTSAVFSVFPNPADAEIRFRGGLEASDRLSLMSADGRFIRELFASNQGVTVGDLKPGLYLIRVESSRGSQLLRFVKR